MANGPLLANEVVSYHISIGCIDHPMVDEGNGELILRGLNGAVEKVALREIRALNADFYIHCWDGERHYMPPVLPARAGCGERFMYYIALLCYKLIKCFSSNLMEMYMITPADLAASAKLYKDSEPRRRLNRKLQPPLHIEYVYENQRAAQARESLKNAYCTAADHGQRFDPFDMGKLLYPLIESEVITRGEIEDAERDLSPYRAEMSEPNAEIAEGSAEALAQASEREALMKACLASLEKDEPADVAERRKHMANYEAIPPRVWNTLRVD